MNLFIYHSLRYNEVMMPLYNSFLKVNVVAWNIKMCNNIMPPSHALEVVKKVPSDCPGQVNISAGLVTFYSH